MREDGGRRVIQGEILETEQELTYLPQAKKHIGGRRSAQSPLSEAAAHDKSSLDEDS